MKKLSYKQRYMRLFNVSADEYDKIYDVYRLRVRKFEKTTGSAKINAAASLFYTAKAQKQGKPLSLKKSEILSTPATTKKHTRADERRLDNYIFNQFRGLIFNSQTAFNIYNDSTLTPVQKLIKLTEYAEKLQKQRSLAREKARQDFDDELPFEDTTGDTFGYDITIDL